MKKVEVRNAFFAQLAPSLPGFQPRKTKELFSRKIPAGEQQVGLALADYNPVFELSLAFSIRLLEVEKIVKMFSGGAPEDELTTSTTFIHYFAKDAPEYVRVSTPEEIAAAVQRLQPILQARVMPFFEAHQDVESLDATFNGPDGAAFNQMNAPYRDMNALTVAWLAGNPRFEALAAAAEKQSRAQGWHPASQAKLAALLKYLREPRA
jgi:hypothetical protein